MLLNLGHTLGHAFEADAGYGALRHGDAVALGMAAACDVAVRLGGAAEPGERLRALLCALSLPTEYSGLVSSSAIGFLHSDKKRGKGGIRFVVPGEPGETRLETLSIDTIRSFF